MPGSENHFWSGVLVGAIISPFILIVFRSVLGLLLSYYFDKEKRKQYGLSPFYIWLKNHLTKDKKICLHLKTHFEDWPDGGQIEVCDVCSMSRYHWEQGESGWIMIEDIPGARKEVEEALKMLRSAGVARASDSSDGSPKKGKCFGEVYLKSIGDN